MSLFPASPARKGAFFLFLFTCISLVSYAQSKVEIARKYVQDNLKTQLLETTDISEMVVSSQYLSPSTGFYHIYFNQVYKSIDVYNGVLNLTLKNGEVVHIGNSFVKNIKSKVSSTPTLAIFPPTQILQNAAKSVGLVASDASQIQLKSSSQNIDGITNQLDYIDQKLSNKEIKMTLYWLSSDFYEAKSPKSDVKLTWVVQFETKDKRSNWNVQVDATSGEVVGKYDEVIHCDFGIPSSNAFVQQNQEAVAPQAFAPNNYVVFDYPLESPNHGSRTTVASPYTKFVPNGTGPGTTNGWHNDGTVDYTTTRGNNVWAQEDANDNNGVGASPVSATLDFNYAYTQGPATAAGNQNAAITNLFYWNNVLHDILWKVGFDEASGNFQNDNQGKGGVGNDYVFADAQDGGGTNNANFYTPADGSNPRMQMYLWSERNGYQPDGSFDNGIIAHEYGHGWSTRLTGGPTNVACLTNSEQGGEGWSDFLTLMTTTNWASLTPNVASANIARGIGTYALGQPTTGAGIRPYPYSYDMANVNGAVTYAKVGDATNFSIPHGVGSIWATILWDMTWEMIFLDNQIVNNIYNTTNIVGNVAALKLVNEGLRLQPCNPSFIDARNAILVADILHFNGKYRCAIDKAFTRRGVGAFASTGVSANDRIVIEDFTPLSGPTLSSSRAISICSNSTFTYTATSSTSGTTFSWTRPVVAGISNSAGSSSSATVSEVLVNTTASPIVVSYYFSLSPSSCPGTPLPQTVSVTVKPSPVPVVASYSICQNGVVPLGEGLVGPTITSTNTINGTLSVSSIYNRSLVSGTSYIASGQSVYFKSYSFVASTTESVTFEITSAAFDSFLTLYSTSFNYASPATNFLISDDDGGNSILSKFSYNLVAGTTYIIVVCSYYDYETGAFTLVSNKNVFPSNAQNQWFTTLSGGSPISTATIFNPVGVSGSGIPNTATFGTYTFYLGNTFYGSCRTPTTFIINQLSVGGSITGGGTVCPNTNAGTLTLSGYVGNIIRWEKSTDDFVTFTSIANTSPTQTYVNLSKNTKFRAIVQNGNCSNAISSESAIDLIPAILNVTTNITTGTEIKNAGEYINATNKISPPANATYRAGKAISLNPGFEAENGSVFKTEILNCPY